MSVAAGIEIVAGGHREPGQSRVSTNGATEAQGAAWAGAPAANPASNFASGLERFRQSMLASLGAELDSRSDEASEAETTPASTEPDLAGVAQTAFSETSPRLSGAVLSSRQGRSQQGGPAISATLSMPGSRTGVPVGQIALREPRQAASSSGPRSLARTQPAESAPSAHSANSGKNGRLEAATGARATSAAPTTAESLPPTIPAPSIPSPVANAPEAQPRSQLAGPSSQSATGFSWTSVNSHSLHSDDSGAAAERTRAAENQTPAAAGTAPLAHLNTGSAGENPDLGQAESSTVGKEALLPERVGPHASEPIHALTQSPMRARPESQGLEVLAAPVVSEEADRGSADAQADASQLGKFPAVPSIPGKPGPASGGRSSTQGPMRLARSAGAGEPTGNGNRLPEGQLAGQALDASTLARDPAGARAATTAANDVSGNSAGAAAGPATRETFAALDAETAPGTPTWIHAGTQRAEAGFQDPALGWVGVRADMGAGGVHASLVPGSADAAQALGGHLAGLNSFLAEQHTPVETLTLAAPEGRWAGPLGDQGTGQGMNQGLNQGADQNTGQGAFSEPRSNPPPAAPDLAAATISEVSAQTGRPDTMVPPARLGGSHISVIA